MSERPDEAEPIREQIFTAIRSRTAATVTEASDATLAILRIVRNARPKGISLMNDAERSRQGLDPNGGFDGPTGAD